MKQRDKITNWVYEEYKDYVTKYDKEPNKEVDEHIIDCIIDKISNAGIWIPSGEIVGYYQSKKSIFP